MTIYPVEADESLKILVAPTDWDTVLEEKEHLLTTEEKYYLEQGPPEYTIAVLIKLGLLGRILH